RAGRDALLARFRALTEKEREVLALIKDGKPNKAISTELDITPRAVEMRRSSLMKKLNVRSLAELLRLSMALELANDSAKGEP
ncbi:response regulator transcription factor, partial [Singulisphaera rosea]